MSDKGSKSGGKKNGVASLRKVAKPVAECKVFFIGKWTAGFSVSDQILEQVKSNITPNGGIKTKIRLFEKGLKVGEKSSMFSAFPEQFYPMICIQSLKRDDRHTNTLILIAKNDAQVYEIMVFRCPTEYEARQVAEEFDKRKVEPSKADTDHLKMTQVSSETNWSLKQSAKYPRQMIAMSVNGINGSSEQNETSKVTVDSNSKTMYIQGAEPIYATVNKNRAVKAEMAMNTGELTERVRLLEMENQRLRAFINSHLVTTYQPVPVRDTEVPVDNVLLMEGNKLTQVTDESQIYNTIRSGSMRSASSYRGSLVGSGQFERGSLHYNNMPVRAESLNGHISQSQQREIQTKFMVPVDTLRRNVHHHTYVPRKIDNVYRAPPTVVAAPPQQELQDVAESLPPRDSISSLDSDIEDAQEPFEITTPTAVRYM